MGENGFYERGGQEIGFVISVGAGDQVRLDIAQAAAQQLREIGVNCTVEVPEKVDWGGQMAYLIGWGSPFDADDHTYKVFGTGKGANYSGYSNPLVDRYLTEARQTDDPVKRREAYDKFQEALADDPAYAFICYIDADYVASSRIRGIDPGHRDGPPRRGHLLERHRMDHGRVTGRTDARQHRYQDKGLAASPLS